jgi:hypothetical protein
MAAYRSFEFHSERGRRELAAASLASGFDGIDRVRAAPGKPWREYGGG